MDLQQLVKLKKLFNNADTEYSFTIILNHIKEYGLVKDEFYPTYFIDELNLSDVNAIIKRLVKRERIFIDENNYMHVTLKGEKYLEKRMDLVDFFNFASPYITVGEYKKLKDEIRNRRGENAPFEEVMISLLHNKLNELIKKDDYLGVKNIHFDIATLYEKYNYFPQAMNHYLISLYFDVAGLEYYDIFLNYIREEYSRLKALSCYDYVYINPYITYALQRLKDCYTDEMVDDIFENHKISINLCNKSMFKKLVQNIMENKYVNSEWQKYFKDTYIQLLNKSERFRNLS